MGGSFEVLVNVVVVEGTFCVTGVTSLGSDSRWGDCANGDIQLRASDAGGSLRQAHGSNLCLGPHSVAHLAGNLQQAPDAHITLGQFTQLFLAPGRTLVLGPGSAIVQEPEHYYSELNIHKTLSLGRDARLRLSTYSYVYVNGELALEQDAEVEMGFRASLYVYDCRAAACSVGVRSRLLLDTGAAFNNRAALSLGASSLTTLGPGSLLDAHGDLELEAAQLQLGERSYLDIGIGAALTIRSRASVILADYAHLVVKDGATLQVLGQGSEIDVGRQGRVVVAKDVFCIIRTVIRVPDQATINLSDRSLGEGVDCHPASSRPSPRQ